MSRPRSFDHARARELRGCGYSYPQIAGMLGVHHTSVMYACDDAYRLRKNEEARDAARFMRSVRASSAPPATT